MAKRPNPPAGEGEEFQDPLENYEPPVYSDKVEEALAEETVAAIQSQPFTTISPDAPIHSAVQVLAGLEIACLLVAEGEQLVGVFSERDVLDRVADRWEDLKDRPVREVMSGDPVFAYDTDSAAAALCVMAASGLRHVPVLDANEKIVGIVSPQRITAFLQQHFES